MGSSAYIDINYVKAYDTRYILKHLLEAGLGFCYEDKVFYLKPCDKDNFNWEPERKENFNLQDFIKQHSPQDRIGISLMFDDYRGGNFHIYHEYISISLAINKKYLFTDSKIPDFNWYIKTLRTFLNSIQYHEIVCSCVL